MSSFNYKSSCYSYNNSSCNKSSCNNSLYNNCPNSNFLTDFYCTKISDLYCKRNCCCTLPCNPNPIDDTSLAYDPFNYDPNHPCSYCLDPMGEEISEICHDEYDYFLNKPNVVGLGLGFKTINGHQTNMESIVVYVEKKLSDGNLPPSALIDPMYRGIPTDVVECGNFTFNRSLKDTIRPAVGGCSIGPAARDSSGTLACLVEDQYGIYILSCNHVLADVNSLFLGNAILQPSVPDGGTTPNSIIAKLDRYIPLFPLVPFTPLSEQHQNEVDCATAILTSPTIASSIIASIDRPPQGIVGPTLNVGVKKVGRSTGLTSGIVHSINGTFIVNACLMVNQIVATPILSAGDSGALLVDANDKAMGLVIGSNNQNYAIANPIIRVLQLLKVSLVTK